MLPQYRIYVSFIHIPNNYVYMRVGEIMENTYWAAPAILHITTVKSIAC